MATQAPDVFAACAPAEFHRTWEASPGVTLTRFVGRTSMSSAEACISTLETVMDRHGSLFMAAQAAESSAYEPGVRELFATWMTKHRARIVANHMLVRSGILKMAIQINNLVTGGLVTPHSNRESFDRALRTHAPGIDLSLLYVPIVGPARMRASTSRVTP